MKFLWLASWYPSKNDPLTGDFFQRHAQAAAINCTVHVLHIKRDDALTTNKEVCLQQHGNLLEKIILYKPIFANIKFISNFFSFLQWNALHKKEIKNWIEENGKPNFVHVTAAWKCGLIALWCKKKFSIPYFISEQYTGYFKEANKIVPTFSFWQHFLLKKIFTHAYKVLPVSNYLGNALQSHYNVPYTVLENVINTNIFKPATKPNNVQITLLHVSLLNLQKNPDLLFKACAALILKGLNFKLQLVAPFAKAQYYLQKYPALKNHVHVLQETNQHKLATIMQAADVLLFPSLFESFGLVAYEAIACGTPVILSNIDVFKPNLIGKPFVYACKVDCYNSLADTIYAFAQHKKSYNANEMFEYIHNNFSLEKNGERIKEIYNS